MIRRLLQSFLVVAASGMYFSSVAEPPRVLPFQARLTDAAGKFLADKPRLVQFQIFADSSSSTTLWSGEIHRVSSNEGLINVMLGTKNPFPLYQTNALGAVSSFFESTLFLEMRIDTTGPKGEPDGYISTEDAPLRPRQTLNPPLFALETKHSANSERIGGLNLRELSNALVPPGTIISFGGVRVPEGWLLCDGRQLEREKYPDLYDALQNTWGTTDPQTFFNLPDLRGMFLRGVDLRSTQEGGRDPDNKRRGVNRSGGSPDYVGSVQEDAFKAHDHATTADNLYQKADGIRDDFNFSYPALADANNVPRQFRTGFSGESETRPKNAYVNFLIKY